MTDKKTKVVAFYREHPTLMAIADQIEECHKAKIERSEFHQKALKKIREEAEAEGMAKWKLLAAELVRLGMITQQEVDAGRLYLDFDTMTIQRCNGVTIMDLLPPGVFHD